MNVFDSPDQILGQEVTLHTDAGNFSGKLVEFDSQGGVLFDAYANKVHVVFDDHLAGVTFESPTEEMLKMARAV